MINWPGHRQSNYIGLILAFPLRVQLVSLLPENFQHVSQRPQEVVSIRGHTWGEHTPTPLLRMCTTYNFLSYNYSVFIDVVRRRTDPGNDRYKFSFTLRDSPADYINATCWGSQDYIKQLHSSFKICDVGKEEFVW